jgi:hypothetical protein
MAGRKTKGARKARSAMPYAQRLVGDQYVQDQLGNAYTKLRAVYARAARQPGKAAEDKQLYGNLREAVTSIRRAVGAIQEPPPKPKRRGRRVLVLATLAVGAALLAKQASG